ncbi:MAG: Zn finger protein HypA/HybF [Pelotomaculum thermopropionicum]|uniref:Hydrogenase maturation factor HypA n=1 Tax=Pelotomaculum thermopropionicum TaxID=110500 RepID=A0A101HSG4_9FIRM|nr:MAG: Zn finger protein HypA/HybF [Pelotomaculum thermopropionicum]
MHEWALAESVVLTALKEAEREQLKEILSVKVKIGELQQIDPEIFKFALESVLKLYDPPPWELSIDKIELETDKSVLQCKVCGNRWNLGGTLAGLEHDQAEAIHFVPEVARVFAKCPRCGSSDFEVIKGRGVWIDCIEGEK